MPQVIDFHAHVLEEECLRQAQGKTVLSGYGANPASVTRAANDVTRQKMLDPQLHVADMARMGVDRNVISVSTVIQGTSWAHPQTDLRLNQRSNDRVAEWCAQHPDRFVGSFTLPLQDVELSLAELDRAVDQLGLRVANLCAQYHGAYLGDARYRPFWEAANDLDIVVWIHPDGTRDLWFQKFGMWNSIGQSIEEVKVMASIVYEGIVETWPNLKIVMAHGGGYFPHYMGRMDRNVTNRPDSMQNITRKPSDYLRAFYYDTCVYDPEVLAALIRRVGADRLVMGSDYPVGNNDPVASVKATPGISDSEVAQITGGNAARLLGLDAR
jgi:aminocarboxymuconate-semialdehyde decarboxylase